MSIETNPLAMDDEAFSKLSGPPEVVPDADAEAAKVAADADAKEVEDDKNKPDDTNKEGADDQDPDDDPQGDDDDSDKADQDDADKDKPGEEGKVVEPDKSADEGKGKKEEPKTDADGKPIGSDPAATPPDYEGFFKKVMAPLNANGKKIELKTPEEAIQLMQMGANYTRKMQAIAPHRKVLTMLENNGLLNDEGKLALLIDINKKDPEAIKKFLKDSGIDPLDIDTKEPSTYREGNHRVSDEEVTFKTALDELASIPEGRETLKQINTQWDQASKDILWKQPEVMTLIHQHRENGIYDLITTEMERQRALGAIPATVSYLQAYKKIGDDLTAQGAFNHLAEKAPEEKPTASHVVTRKVIPKKDPNGDKANAASTSRNAGRKAETVVNPLSLSDEEFEKQFDLMQGRV
jgi:hypothetical protein